MTALYWLDCSLRGGKVRWIYWINFTVGKINLTDQMIGKMRAIMPDSYADHAAE